MRNSSGINRPRHPCRHGISLSPSSHPQPQQTAYSSLPDREITMHSSHSQLFLKRFRHRYIIRRHRRSRSGRRHGNGMIEMTRNLAGQTRYVVGIPALRSQRSRRRVLRKRRSRPPGTPLNAAHGSRLDFGIGRIVQISGNFMNLDRLHSFRIIQAGRQVVRDYGGNAALLTDGGRFRSGSFLHRFRYGNVILGRVDDGLDILLLQFKNSFTMGAATAPPPRVSCGRPSCSTTYAKRGFS